MTMTKKANVTKPTWTLASPATPEVIRDYCNHFDGMGRNMEPEILRAMRECLRENLQQRVDVWYKGKKLPILEDVADLALNMFHGYIAAYDGIEIYLRTQAVKYRL